MSTNEYLHDLPEVRHLLSSGSNMLPIPPAVLLGLKLV